MKIQTKTKGWLKPEDIEPELLAKIRKYNERFKYYHTYLGYHEHVEANRLAQLDAPLTDEELDVKRRLLETAQNLVYKNSSS